MAGKLIMTRYFSMAALCVCMAACSASNDNANSSATPVNNNVALNPAAMALDHPPVDGNLPAELRPPGT